MGLVAPLLLVPVEVAVDQLVVVRAARGSAERRPHFARALVADLAAAAADVRPGVVRFGVGDRLVVLVAQPALEGAVGRPVRMVAVVTTFVPGHVGVVGVDDLFAAAQRDVAVVGAVHRLGGPHGAFFALRGEAVFHARRGQQEVLVDQVSG